MGGPCRCANRTYQGSLRGTELDEPVGAIIGVRVGPIAHQTSLETHGFLCVAVGRLKRSWYRWSDVGTVGHGVDGRCSCVRTHDGGALV